MNGVFRVTFFSLSTLQVTTCILGSWVFVKDYSMSGLNKTWIDTLAFVLTFLLPLSCLFLFDAFRRMSQIQGHDNVISKKTVILHSTAYLAFTVSLILVIYPKSKNLFRINFIAL